jgi:hypothetical protein
MNLFHLAIPLEIIAIVLATFLLAKTRTELMGRWFRWGAYVLVIAGWLALACTITHGICRLICCSSGGCEMSSGNPHECDGMEACGSGDHHGMNGGWCKKHGEGKGMRREHRGFGHEHEHGHDHVQDSL